MPMYIHATLHFENGDVIVPTCHYQCVRPIPFNILVCYYKNVSSYLITTTSFFPPSTQKHCYLHSQ